MAPLEPVLPHEPADVLHRPQQQVRIGRVEAFAFGRAFGDERPAGACQNAMAENPHVPFERLICHVGR